MIKTVLGEIPAGDLGFTLPHEHLLFDLFRGFQPHREFLVNDPELAGTELGHFAAAGGGTVVELTTPDLGRRPTELVEISRRTGINVVMCTGRYREPFYEESLDRTSTATLASEFIDEIERGVDGVRAGIIGEIGTHESFISPPEERVHRAAARAHIATGVAITTHANASPVGLSQLDLFEEEGVDLRRVVVGHCDTYPFLDYHRAILLRGAYVQYDTIRGNFEVETERQIDQLMILISEGHLERLLLSQDMGSNRFYKVYGGRGFDFLVTEFVDRLKTRGLSQEQLDILTIWNPRRMLTGEDIG